MVCRSFQGSSMKKIITVWLAGFLLLGCWNMAQAKADDASMPPAEINDRAGLEAIAQQPDGNYLLTCDIDMGDKPWEPLAFSGTLNGNGHTLYNLTIEQPGVDRAQTVDGNHRGYDTVFASLFSVTEHATIRDLQIRNMKVSVETDENCFAAGIAGYAAGTEIADCSISGRIQLTMSNKMCGVAGVVGYGYGTVTNTDVDTTLVLVDTNREVRCEEFLGGVLACGYTDIDGCEIRLDGYASVHGYVHNGGIVGMDHIHPRDKSHKGYVKNCTVDATIRFFEDNEDRRAYCREYIGERLNKQAILSNNTTVGFESIESKNFDQPLLPEACAQPQYTETVTEPTCTEFGYTTFTCATCGYSYTDRFTPPAHHAGEWETVQEPTYAQTGLRERFCTGCGVKMEEEELPVLRPAERCTLSDAAVELGYPASYQLTARLTPEDVSNTGLVWSSADAAVATVDDTGMIQTAGEGTATITCASADGFVQASCTVTVHDTLWQSIEKILKLR